MAVKTYSLKRQGGNKLTAHFRIREFKCNDGSDTILIDEKLAKLLEQLRTWAGGSIRITSAYRTPVYNKRIGGATNSQHTKGTAADIVVTGKDPAAVAKFAQAIGAGGVGHYTAQKFTHVDTRPGRSYWRNDGKGDRTVSTHGGKCPYSAPVATAKRGSKGNGVRWVQWWLRLWGYQVSIDGVFGAKTEAAVEKLQTRLDLEVDGKVGKITRNALRGIV